MNCINDEIIQKYIDCEVKQDEIVLLEQHLKECTSCSEKVELQRDLSNKLKSAIDSIVDDNIEIPAFKPGKRRVLLRRLSLKETKMYFQFLH